MQLSISAQLARTSDGQIRNKRVFQRVDLPGNDRTTITPHNIKEALMDAGLTFELGDRVELHLVKGDAA